MIKNVKKYRRQEKNSCFKPFSRVFFLFLMLYIAQFSIISATDWMIIGGSRR